MNAHNAALPVAAPPKAPPAPKPAHEADSARAAREAARREEAFDRALEAELKGKHTAPPEPPLLPWFLQPQAQGEDAGDIVEASLAAESENPDALRQLALLASRRRDRGPDLDADELIEAVTPRAAKPEPETITVVVEPGLPIVQPHGEAPRGPVPLADFPQVVVGQVRQMNENNQPVTQLDFEISPPHVGPVNLQVNVQNGAVNVQLVALTMQAKQALETQVGSIHEILQAHQLTPGQVKVVTAPSGRSGFGGAGKGEQAPGFGFFHGGRRRSSGRDEGDVGEV